MQRRTSTTLILVLASVLCCVGSAVSCLVKLGLPAVEQPQPGDFAVDADAGAFARAGGSLDDGTVVWYRAAEPANLHKTAAGVGGIPHLIVCSSTVVAWSPYGEIRAFDTREPGNVRRFKGLEFHDVALSPNGNLVAYSLKSEALRIVEWRTGRVVATLPHDADELCFASDNMLVFVIRIHPAMGAYILSTKKTLTTTWSDHSFALAPLRDATGVAFVRLFQPTQDQGQVSRWIPGKEPEALFASSSSATAIPIKGGLILIDSPQPFRPWRLSAQKVDYAGHVLSTYAFSAPIVKLGADRAGRLWGLSEDGRILEAR